ncbi:MAG: dihydrolipoamide acetyltransferase family protein [Chloroflexota bacterium]
MATKVTMPKLGLTMTEGKVVEWRKQVGETVTKGEILYVIETEKVTFEVEAPDSGVLGKIVAAEGEVVPVGGVVAYIVQPGEKLADLPETGVKPAAEAAAAPGGGTAPGPRPEAKGLEGAKISPVARKMAEEHGIDVSGVTGSGPGGRIVREDIEKAIKAGGTPTPAAAAPAPGRRVEPMSSMRKVIARRMIDSWQQTPHFQLTLEVDATRLIAARKALLPAVEAEAGVRLTFTDLLTRIVAQALADFPEMNVSYTPEGLVVIEDVDIGLVADVGGGLIVPVIRQASRKSLAEIAQTRNDLITRARDGKLGLDEMTGSSFTISNLGMYPIDQFCAIINPPQAAILAVGRTIEKPVVVDGQIVVRSRISLTLGIDHRCLDGVIGAKFLGRVRDIIEDPSLLFPQLKDKL